MLRDYFPKWVNNELFGFREQFGKKPEANDPDWKRWSEVYPDAYRATQKSTSAQMTINNAGYEVLKGINLQDAKVAEIGPGGGYHFSFFQGKPASYTAFDVNPIFLADAEKACQERDIAFAGHKVEAYSPKLALPSASQDFVISFYSLEHLHPLETWLDEVFRILKPGGQLVGAIPSEGGVAWGLGRWLTSRRTLMKNYGLDVRKIVCWEHPNTADEILEALAKRGTVSNSSWPVPALPIDLSLILKLKVTK
jgi:SAM-dependent methyltransferase